MKEDEREVLAHIVQNIDEQEIFLEFVAKAETIKEAWQITKIFEKKKKEFVSNLREYDTLIKDKEKQLKIITAEIADANNLLKDANNELENVRTQLNEMRNKAKLLKNKILHGKQSQYANFYDNEDDFLSSQEEKDSDILNFDDIIQDIKPLSTVSVHVKNGATAMARAAEVIYSQELYDIYKKAGIRLFKLKDKINELELSNKKLAIELRDLSEEDNFKENMRNKMGLVDDSHDEYDTMIPNIKQSSDFIGTTLITSNLDSVDVEERIEMIDKKKEKVEEMFQQLNNLLHDDVSKNTKEVGKEVLQSRNVK